MTIVVHGNGRTDGTVVFESSTRGCRRLDLELGAPRANYALGSTTAGGMSGGCVATAWRCYGGAMPPPRLIGPASSAPTGEEVARYGESGVPMGFAGCHPLRTQRSPK